MHFTGDTSGRGCCWSGSHHSKPTILSLILFAQCQRVSILIRLDFLLDSVRLERNLQTWQVTAGVFMMSNLQAGVRRLCRQAREQAACSHRVQVYRDLAAKDGISLDSAPHGVRDFLLTALPGGYRRLLHRPRDLNWRLLRYSDPDAPLASSTLDRLTGVAPPAVNVITPGIKFKIYFLNVFHLVRQTTLSKKCWGLLQKPLWKIAQRSSNVSQIMQDRAAPQVGRLLCAL